MHNAQLQGQKQSHGQGRENNHKTSIFTRWLKKRMPANNQHTLNQRSIFIFPSRFGFMYLFVCIFLYTLGTNYQNNLILLLTFTLIGFFITSIIYSYGNLSGLTIKSSQVPAMYANESSFIPLYLSDCVNRNELTFNFKQQHGSTLEIAKEQDKVQVPFKPLTRGKVNPERVTIISYFPLGLLRCWTVLDMNIELIVYPEPLDDHVPLLTIDDGQEQQNKSRMQLNEFEGIKDHIAGESLSRISWKHVARNQQKLVSKHFSDVDSTPKWLALSHVRGDDIEQRLSKLTYAIDHYTQEQATFGLLLDNQTIAPDSGEKHRQTCLEALALYQGL